MIRNENNSTVKTNPNKTLIRLLTADSTSGSNDGINNNTAPTSSSSSSSSVSTGSNGTSDGIKNTEITENINKSLTEVVKSRFMRNIINYDIETLSDRGENAYGSVLELKVNLSDQTDNSKEILAINKPLLVKGNIFYCIAKISPKNEARRETMKVFDYYKREKYVYEHILSEYNVLQLGQDNNYNTPANIQFMKHLNLPPCTDTSQIASMMMMISPKLYASSLDVPNEFLLLEDLNQFGYSRFSRTDPLPYEHTVLAVRELAKFHAMSFVLRTKNPKKFDEIVQNISVDNLFSESMNQVSVEFGKKYLKAAIDMLDKDTEILSDNPDMKSKIISAAETLNKNFKAIGIELVNGKTLDPHAVICHGDYWNNNILYKDEGDVKDPKSAKVIDFQMVRYAAPVTDFIHYLFTCTGKSLRDRHFDNFKDNYYNQLTSTLRNFNLDANALYPRLVFENQLQQYGIHGLTMASLALPFFISDSSEVPNFDQSSEAIKELDADSLDDAEIKKNQKTAALLKEYEMLNPRNTPIFKERMIGILLDLAKYNMLNTVFLKK